MEDWASKSDVLQKKLQNESQSLAKLQQSLNMSKTNSVNMDSVLAKFEYGLTSIERDILPVYERTRDYQIQQENMEKTLKSIDKAINCYNVAKETRSIIKCDHGPLSKDLNQYMNAMVQLKSAIDYFTEYHPGSPEYSEVNSLYQSGKKAIEKEFQALLTQYSRPLTPIQISDLLGDNEEDEFAGTHTPITANTYLPRAARNQLQEIAKWLSVNLSTSDFTIVYANTRASVITKSLQGLIDHQKSASGESIVSAAPSVHHTIRPSRPSKHKHKLFSNRLLKKALMKGGDSPLKKDEESFAVEMDGFVACVSALLKLIEFESELLNSIIPQKHQRRVFDIVLQPALDMIVKEGDKIGSCAQRAASHYNFREVPVLFPVVRHLRQLKPQFDLKLEGCQPSSRSKFTSLITSLDNIGNRILDLFIESIQNDPDKASNMPIDGTVHELTRNTMFFMNTLKDHAEVAGAMLMVQEPMYTEQNIEHLRTKVAAYMTKVLSALGINLKNKSETYGDVYLGAVFMLNNFNYILQSLVSQDLLDMVHRYDPNVATFYDVKLKEQTKQYNKSTSKLISYISEPAGVRGQPDPIGKLSDKEKQAIKDRFTGFNRELEDLCRVQKLYVIPDPELRQQIISRNKQTIGPTYERFRERYMRTNFTKNAEKYIKYTAHDVDDMLDKTFDAAS